MKTQTTDPNFVLNGKFYNTKTSTLILESINEKIIQRWYKSAKGTYYRTITDIQFSINKKGIEKVSDETNFKTLRTYLDHVQKGNAKGWQHKFGIIPDEFKVIEEA